MTIQYRCVSFDELSLQELYKLLALRQAVFVVEQNCPYLDADGLDQEAMHLLGIDEEGELVAYTRLLAKGIAYEKYPAIGRVITSEKIRGQKKGRELMEVSVKYCEALFGKMDIKISAQAHLEKYYNSVGFIATGEAYLEDDIPHIGMIRSAS